MHQTNHPSVQREFDDNGKKMRVTLISVGNGRFAFDISFAEHPFWSVWQQDFDNNAAAKRAFDNAESIIGKLWEEINKEK